MKAFLLLLIAITPIFCRDAQNSGFDDEVQNKKYFIVFISRENDGVGTGHPYVV